MNYNPAPMKYRWLFLGLFFSCCTQLWGQNIDRIEYFFDTDPGFGNGTAVSITAMPNIQNLSFAIDWSSLNDGYHIFNVRTQDENGNWSYVQHQPLFKGSLPAFSNPSYDVVNAEYFLDSDPGFGNGTPISVSGAMEISNLAVPIDISSLNDGFHNLIIRVQNANGVWSLTRNYFFFTGDLPINSLTPSNISEVEYFIDTDPGLGNGTQVPVMSGTDVPNVTFNVDISNLSTGIHNLFVRSKDDQGRWSLHNKYVFLKGDLPIYPLTPSNISEVEYFIDTDPGLGNGTSVPIMSGMDVPNVTFNVDISNLSTGIHNLFVRSKDDQGRWSLHRNYPFLKGNLPTFSNNSPNLQELEYFFDTDPGIGNGTLVTIPATTDTSGFALNLDISGLSFGMHEVLVRTKDANGQWSITNTNFFYKIDPSTLPTADITELEYFFNTDPGIGNGTSVSLPASINVQSHAFSIDISGLADDQLHTLFVRTKDEDDKWSLARLKSFYKFQPVPSPVAGNIAVIEYFIDNDPGIGNGNQVTFTPNTEIPNLTFPVDITSLNSGFHTLVVRSQDSDGKWSVSNNYVFFKDGLPTFTNSLADIVAVEYFIDNDPGYGNGNQVAITPNTEIPNLTFPVDIASLTTGFHILRIRSKNADGEWSRLESYSFFKDGLPTFTNSLTDIVDIEYFIDNDPGFGNGTSVSFTAATDINQLTFPVDITSLSNGFHKLTVRTKNGEGDWSMETQYSFFKDELPVFPPMTTPDIIALEYFFDDDPGYGNGTKMSLPSGTDIQSYVLNIDISAISNGFHQFNIRTEDSDGGWSMLRQEILFIDDLPIRTPDPATNIVAMEYFIGDDPGIGNATPLPITASLDISQYMFQVSGTALLPGTNEVKVRAKDASGKWSILARDEYFAVYDDIGVTEIVTPVSNCVSGTEEKLKVVVQNIGGVAKTDFEIAYSFNNGNVVTEMVSTSKLGNIGDTLHFEFNEVFDMSMIGSYDFKIYTISTSDIDPDNDEFEMSIQNTGPIGPPTNLIPIDGLVGVKPPVPLYWFPGIASTKYDVYVWEDGTPQPSAPVVSDHTPISYTFNTTWTSGTKYNWQVVGKNEYCETPSAIQSFTLDQLPDLAPSNIQVPNAPLSGKKTEISYSIENIGMGPTDMVTWRDAVYLSTDQIFGNDDDILLGTYPNLISLNPGLGYSRMVEVTLPNGIFGSHNIFVNSDIYKNVGEDDEDNNISAPIPINITLSPYVDLRVTSILAPNNAFSGKKINLQWTVTNNGTGGGGGKDQIDAIYQSTSPVLDGNAVLLDVFIHSQSIQVDSSRVRSMEVKLADDILGSSYIHVVTDAGDKVYEFLFEDNNDNVSSVLNVFLTPPPDLVVNSVTAPSIATPKEVISISWETENVGAVNIAPESGYPTSWTNPSVPCDCGMGNKPNIFDLGDAYNEVKDYNINWRDGIYISQSESFNIDSSIFLGVRQKNLNIKITTKDSEICNYGCMFPPPPPIIVISSSNNPGTNNNPGTSNIFPCSNLVNCISYVKPLLMEVTQVDSLNIGETYTASRNVTIPANTPPGKYYIYLHTDYLDDVNEFPQDTNNVFKADSIIILPNDLIIDSVSVDSVANSGETVGVSWRVKNIAQGKVSERKITDYVYYSTNPVFHIDSVTLARSLTYIADLEQNETIDRQTSFKLPQGISGDYYVFIKTDALEQVLESDETNNMVVDSFKVNLSPWPDLQVTNISGVPMTAIAGDLITLTYTAENLGTDTIKGTFWKDYVYISPDTAWNPANAKLLKNIYVSQLLAPGDSYQKTTQFSIPMIGNAPTGVCFLWVHADEFQDKIFEHTDEDNNYLRSIPIFVTAPESVDFELTNLTTLPDTVETGQSVSLDWSVKNNGESTALWGYGLWYDGVYLSDDPMLSSDDMFVKDFSQNGPIIKDQSYDQKVTFKVPNEIFGDYYAFMSVDHLGTTNDDDLSNNQQIIFPASNPSGGPGTATIHIKLKPPPDLQVPTVIIPPASTSGQPVKVIWEVKNDGTGGVIENWTDRIYLSTDIFLDGGDILLKEIAQTENLAPGASFFDTTTVFPSVNLNGNFLLIVETDAGDKIFEFNNEDNNTMYGVISITQPPPADLTVSDMSFANMAMVGEAFTVDYGVYNQSTNTVKGMMKDLVYFSTDSILDVSDLKFGGLPTRDIDLGPMDTVAFSTTSKTPGLPLGDYFIIATTDVQDNIYELDNTNNFLISSEKVTIGVQELPLDTLIGDKISRFQRVYYRIDVPDTLVGETLRLTLDGFPGGGVNELYLSHEEVPTRSNHDFSSIEYSTDQQLIVPELEVGTYYLMAYNWGSTGQKDIDLFAEIINFQILSIDAKNGGNTGNVTVKLNGAKFTTDMTVKIQDATLGSVTANKLVYVNSTEVFVTFNLAGAAIGTYDVLAEKTNEVAVLNNGFDILKGDVGTGVNVGGSGGSSNPFSCSIVNIGNGDDLARDLGYPNSVRRNRIVAITIQFANKGLIDIPAPTRVMVSLRDAPLALNPEDIDKMDNDKNAKELLLEFEEPGGPPGILRPGAVNVITVYTFSSHPLRFVLQE